MNIDEFIPFWRMEYPEALPINYELKSIYQDRWFRIHSLPESKRYATSKDEYQIIFDRQNFLIDDLIGEGTEIVISFGLYRGDATNILYTESTDFGEFQKVMTIDLYKERPEEYESPMFFDIYIKIEKWSTGTKNDMLKAIADDTMRAMLVCPAKKCIVSPYDGGVDIIVESTEKRNRLKFKYQAWLSEREDGL